MEPQHAFLLPLFRPQRVVAAVSGADQAAPANRPVNSPVNSPVNRRRQATSPLRDSIPPVGVVVSHLESESPEFRGRHRDDSIVQNIRTA